MSRKRERWQDRKDRLARERQDRKRHRVRVAGAGVVMAIAFVAVLAAYYILVNSGSGGSYAPAAAAGTNAATNQVVIPVSDVSTNAKFYTYDSGGTTVRFFAAKGGDGQIHVATDACDVCYSNHKGYHQSGASMQCNNCGKVFGIDNIGTKNTSGGCWPSYLPGKVDGGNVVVNKSDLDGKAYMFR